MKKRKVEQLIKEATKVRLRAYAPYSGFKVGAALETERGKIYTGCNIENTSFGISICAERVALFKAISEGERKFKRIVIVTGSKELSFPCGTCRQALHEFSSDIEVVLVNLKRKMKIIPLSKLFPNPFWF